MFLMKSYTCKKVKKPDIFLSREKIFKNQNNNLLFLLNKRFSWMKNFIKHKKIIIELGSGKWMFKKNN